MSLITHGNRVVLRIEHRDREGRGGGLRRQRAGQGEKRWYYVFKFVLRTLRIDLFTSDRSFGISVFVVVLMAVLLGVLNGVRGNGHYQAPVLHTFEADKAVGKLRHPGRFAVNDQHFKAGVVVEVGVTGGDHKLVVCVLNFSELFRDAVSVVVVDEGDGADHSRVRGRGLLSDQAVADQVAKGFRPVGIATMARWSGQTA